MLNIQVTPHREFLPADTPDQKLFVMLKLRPTKEVSLEKPPTLFAFVIDTSGSMYEVVTGNFHETGKTVTSDGQSYKEVKGGKAKIDIVIESLLGLINSGKLESSDKIALIRFDDTASVLVGLTPATDTQTLEKAIQDLRNYSGGTRMGLGMRHALDIVSNQDMASRRALIFTDGETFDEDQCRELVKEFVARNIPITALGVGDYKEDLLINLSDRTGGRVLHVVDDLSNVSNMAVSISNLPLKIVDEFNLAKQDVITNLALTVKTVQSVRLSRVLRAYPSQAEFSLEEDPHPLGNVTAGDETVFILEFDIESRPAAKARIAQIGLTYEVPGENRRGELPPQNLVVQFITGQAGTAQVDPEVMGYMQQCNIAQIVGQATKLAEQDPDRAEELLENARRMTVRLGNNDLLDALNGAQDELRKTRKISANTRKTVKMGAKGKTVKMMSGDINDELSEEKIRQISGT